MDGPDECLMKMFVLCFPVGTKSTAGKTREEITLEKKLELEKRLQDVSGQLNCNKKTQKTKGKN